MFTLYRMAFAQARKTLPESALFTLKNGDFGAISVTDRSCAASILKLERHISDRFLATYWCNVNGYSDRGGSE